VRPFALPHRALAHAGLLLALAGTMPAAAAGTYAGALAVDAIRGSIAGRDCATAVKRLKSGLENAYPEVALLAGSMYENGLCVKRDWSRAVTFYVQAHDAGEKDGAARIAAGYADPANGPDVAAALWWAGKVAGFQPGGCGTSKEAAADPDRFVAELKTWPQARLAVCNYYVGVLSTISAEVKYPDQAAAHAIGGDVKLRFLPGIPRIDLQRGASREYEMVGWVMADTLRDRKTRRMADGFETELSRVANRALQRYPHPGGIPADTVIETQFSFGIQYQSR
jgi:TPR repeat protein